MNRAALIAAVAARAQVERKVVDRVLRALFSTDPGLGVVADALEFGERVTLSGFGTFETRQRQPRRVRDPRTGSVREVPGCRVAAFRPGIPLRERLRL